MICPPIGLGAAKIRKDFNVEIIDPVPIGGQHYELFHTHRLADQRRPPRPYGAKGHTTNLDLQAEGSWLKDAKEGKSLRLKKQ